MNQTVDKRKYADRREYLIEAVKKRRKKIREKAIDYHLSDSNKDFRISSGDHARSWERVKSELEKCMLLCANCHREIQAKSQRPDESQGGKSGEFREAVQL